MIKRYDPSEEEGLDEEAFVDLITKFRLGDFYLLD